MLKCYSYLIQKADCNVEIPENFFPSNYVEKNNNNKFELIGIVSHLGETGIGGHFIAICKHSIDGKWRMYNDSIVSECKNDYLKKGTPYILFYKKIISNKSNNKQNIVDINQGINNELLPNLNNGFNNINNIANYNMLQMIMNNNFSQNINNNYPLNMNNNFQQNMNNNFSQNINNNFPQNMNYNFPQNMNNNYPQNMNNNFIQNMNNNTLFLYS